MTAKVIATILNRHQKIFIYEHNGQKYTGRMWVIEPLKKIINIFQKKFGIRKL